MTRDEYLSDINNSPIPYLALYEYWKIHKRPEYKELQFNEFMQLMETFIEHFMGKYIPTPEGNKIAHLGTMTLKVKEYFDNHFQITT